MILALRLRKSGELGRALRFPLHFFYRGTLIAIPSAAVGHGKSNRLIEKRLSSAVFCDDRGLGPDCEGESAVRPRFLFAVRDFLEDTRPQNLFDSPLSLN